MSTHNQTFNECKNEGSDLKGVFHKEEKGRVPV